MLTVITKAIQPVLISELRSSYRNMISPKTQDNKNLVSFLEIFDSKQSKKVFQL
jgi:hypothetical protein